MLLDPERRRLEQDLVRVLSGCGQEQQTIRAIAADLAALTSAAAVTEQHAIAAQQRIREQRRRLEPARRDAERLWRRLILARAPNADEPMEELIQLAGTAFGDQEVAERFLAVLAHAWPRDRAGRPNQNNRARINLARQIALRLLHTGIDVTPTAPGRRRSIYQAVVARAVASLNEVNRSLISDDRSRRVISALCKAALKRVSRRGGRFATFATSENTKTQ